MRKITVLFAALVLFFMMDVNAQWVPISPAPALNAGDMHDVFFIDANTGYAAGEGSGKGVILKTTDGGTSWTQVFITNGNGLWIYSIHFVNSTTGFACGELGYVRRTTDAGNTWSSLQLTDKELACIRFIDANNGLTCGDNNSTNRGPTFKTTDSGITWQQVNNSVAHMDNIYYLDQNIVFASGDYVIHKSTDGGNSWNDIYPGNRDCNAVFFNNINTGFACGNYTMLKTTNAGANWTEFLVTPIDTNYHSSVYFTDLNTGYISLINISTYAGKIYKTINGGTNWQLQQTLSGYANTIKFMNANTGFACGGGDKIWKTTNGGGPIGIQMISTEIPNAFSLKQNYPNPFNPTTKIRFSVPAASQRHAFDLRLIVYDVLGREVTILVNEQLKPGTYEVDWNASNYPSGVYFYTLRSEQFSETKRMVLIK